mgnify:CR=1 FL=1
MRGSTYLHRWSRYAIDPCRPDVGQVRQLRHAFQIGGQAQAVQHLGGAAKQRCAALVTGQAAAHAGHQLDEVQSTLQQRPQAGEAFTRMLQAYPRAKGAQLTAQITTVAGLISSADSSSSTDRRRAAPACAAK